MARRKTPEPLPRELRSLVAAIVETAQRLLDAESEADLPPPESVTPGQAQS